MAARMSRARFPDSANIMSFAGSVNTPSSNGNASMSHDPINMDTNISNGLDAWKRLGIIDIIMDRGRVREYVVSALQESKPIRGDDLLQFLGPKLRLLGMSRGDVMDLWERASLRTQLPLDTEDREALVAATPAAIREEWN
eukprot:TRINITY_DN10663_c0_g1::TRINITY_DN10663_c0_g1_i1::g.11003::m.11003 TRINITY_DN10663_c0_g1::TRINITY_DN10663_c0_g1_i1::g.11003  ORF type:complete len:141 (+),score=11.85 TRINITY_DN10663_c0_g1_i1:1-423(+)